MRLCGNKKIRSHGNTCPHFTHCGRVGIVVCWVFLSCGYTLYGYHIVREGWEKREIFALNNKQVHFSPVFTEKRSIIPKNIVFSHKISQIFVYLKKNPYLCAI